MKQQFKIIQKQKLSTKQIQSVKVLQLSWQELNDFIESSLVDNPFSDFEQSDVTFDIKDADYKKVYKKTDELQDFEYVDQSENDLINHVLPQLYPYMKTKKDEEICRTILESLDTRGFLSVERKDLAQYLNCTEGKLNYFLGHLKLVDPKGLGCKDMQDCILYQLSLFSGKELPQSIVKNHLSLVSVGSFAAIAKQENVSVEEVKEAVGFIQSLNPIPANGFRVQSKSIYVIPDAYVICEDNTISVEMNYAVRDKLTLNKENYELYRNTKFSKEDKKFLTDKLNNFRWLQYSTNRRFKTVQQIIVFLVNYQRDYFLTGNSHVLKPLRLVDVAEALNLHASTISRAISNKYFRCDYGFFPFRFLMPKSYQKSGAEQNPSIESLQGEIKEIIALEDKEHPYSDEKIKQILQEEGYDVSRRTVTLYRNACFIPSSNNRRITRQNERKDK